MKLISLLVLLLIALPQVVFADCACKQPPKPELPSTRADAKEMEKSGKDIDDYSKKMKKYRDCIATCLNKADNDVAGVISGWNYAVERYNTGIAPKQQK